MSLGYIIDRVANEAGYEDLDLNAEQRERLLDIINVAAEQVWEETDLPGCLREVRLCVTPNNIIALPYFVGAPRAVREVIDELPSNLWTLRDMRPKYHEQAWPEMWNKWRIVGTSPTKIQITNSAPFVYTIPTADSTVVVTAVGQTDNGTREREQITMSSTSVTGTKNFVELKSLRLNKIADADITVSDADGVEIAIIYNEYLTSEYLLIDVSDYPSTGAESDGTFTMDLLYKMRLPRLDDDGDVFPVTGFDNVIVDKVKQLLLESQEGKEERAILADKKVTRTIKQKVEHMEGTTIKRLQFRRNPLYSIFSQYSSHMGCRMRTRYDE